ncbi:MAG: protein kinase [Chloroflexi bacterium]|nr:protein kinase [Chloroflexota bacterium]
MDWVGKTVSRVEIRELLGKGAMAQVYLGQHTTLERPVAVKVMQGFMEEDSQALERFRKEAQAVAALRHPNIVQVYDFDLLDGQPYMVMELLSGVPLDVHLESLHSHGLRLPPETTVRLIASLAAALDYAHDRGLVHRDIKPANIILRRDSGALSPGDALPLDADAVLTDFGLARLIDENKMSASGAVTGTPVYISPEQARGLPVDRRSDIYSLAVVLYEMLAGKTPYHDTAENIFSLIFKHASEDAPPIEDLDPLIQAVLDKALVKAIEQRYFRAGQLAADLFSAVFRVPPPQAGALADAAPLSGVLAALDNLLEQARAYERALPPGDYSARLAIDSLRRLAEQARNEAAGLAAVPQAQPASHPFSPRELEVLQLAASGLTNKEIAYRLGISERTVEFHMGSIFNKTTTESRTEAVALALGRGWIDPPG